MKKLNSLLLFTFCCFLSQAQITFLDSDIPTPPFTNPCQKDTLTSRVINVNFGNPGANQVYDFSNLHNTRLDSVYYLVPTSTQSSNVPGTTVAITADHNTYLFGQNATTFFDYDGGQTPVNGNSVITSFSPIDTAYKFPTVYGHNFHGTYGFTKVVSGSSVGLSFPVNNVQIINTTTYTDTIDGWGTVKTPVGTYNCLRQKRIEHSNTQINYNTVFSSTYTNYETVNSNTINYNYLAKETHGSVITFTYDSINEPLTASWSTLPPYPVANFSATNGANGLVTFRDSSTGSPTTYTWNFGDGSATSSTHSPTHNYSRDSTYYVCLTVSNLSGTSTHCDSVHVTNAPVVHLAPVAVKDTATVTQPGSVTINVTANDINYNAPDSVCVTTVWGAPAGWTTISGCSNVVFHPLVSGFTGLDTFYYRSCDATLTTLCDTGIVVVRVLAAPRAPIAIHDTAAVTQPGSVTINVLANDSNFNTPDAVCITTVWGTPSGWETISGCNSVVFHALDSSFSGLDTFYYRSCDQVQTTLCDTGMVVVTVTGAAVPLPVAGYLRYEIGVGICGDTLVNNSQNASSISWHITGTNFAGTLDTTINGQNSIIVSVSTGFPNGYYTVCLTATNTSGSDSVCFSANDPCEGINEIKASDYKVFPNPASDRITLDLTQMNQNTTAISAIEIRDLLGNTLKTIPVNTAILSISVSDLSSGVYFMSVLDKAQNSKVLGKFEVLK